MPHPSAPPAPVPFRVLHTADWHLGHTLRDLSRTNEHDAFLAWLLDRLAEEQVDALLIAGDVFDAAHPTTSAQRAWFKFLRDARRRCPELDIVATAGNHDSGARLTAPAVLLEEFGVRVIGGLPREASGALLAKHVVMPLTDRTGRIAAHCVAMPYLRPADLPSGRDLMAWRKGAGDRACGDELVDGVRALHDRIFDVARPLLESNDGNTLMLAMAHAFMVGGSLSVMSERRILGGNQHALPVDVFPDDLDYVALGHLHKAQRVGGKERVRYCGSPIPLSIAERNYRHRVLLAEWTWEQREADPAFTVRDLEVPRTVQFARLPAKGAWTVEECEAELVALPKANHDADASQRSTWPFIEVVLDLAKPVVGAVERVQSLLANRAVRLVKVSCLRPDRVASLDPTGQAVSLQAMEPRDVFVQFLQRGVAEDAVASPVAPALLGAFDELVEDALAEATPVERITPEPARQSPKLTAPAESISANDDVAKSDFAECEDPVHETIEDDSTATKTTGVSDSIALTGEALRSRAARSRKSVRERQP